MKNIESLDNIYRIIPAFKEAGFKKFIRCRKTSQRCISLAASCKQGRSINMPEQPCIIGNSFIIDLRRADLKDNTHREFEDRPKL